MLVPVVKGNAMDQFTPRERAEPDVAEILRLPGVADERHGRRVRRGVLHRLAGEGRHLEGGEGAGAGAGVFQGRAGRLGVASPSPSGRG